MELRCTADWLDLPGPFRALPVWLERELWLERFELGPLGAANWLPFEFGIAASLPQRARAGSSPSAGASRRAVPERSATPARRCRSS